MGDEARTHRTVLTIAGSDPSGGAGIQADLATFAAFGVHGAAVITALTAQNARGIRAISAVAPAFVGEQLDAVLDDADVAAAKTGMLHEAAVVDVVADCLSRRPISHLVVDPVLAATSGAILLAPDAVVVLRRRLLPLAAVVTPNLHEAELLTGRPATTPDEMRDAARGLVDLGARAALVTGGHLAGDAVDVLWDGREMRELSTARIGPDSPHGTGCALSAAVAAGLAIGLALPDAVATAKRYVTLAIAAAPRGRGPRPIGRPAAFDPKRAR
jgi:hydroxymethylpyrimidine/phosphomethylpyrimidine kinase